jgi:hypothetical protein
MSRPAFTLKNDPRRYQSRGAIGGSRHQVNAASFNREEQRERAERAVIDDRGYIHFARPTIQYPKGS